MRKYATPEERLGRLALKTKIIVRKFANEEALKKNEPYEVKETEGNIGLNEGIGELWDLACGLGTPIKYDATSARLAVSDNTAAELATQIGLQGATGANASMDSGYPSRSTQTLSLRSTYGGTVANWPWNEFTVVNATADTGKNLIRKVSLQGTKTSGQTWELTIQITMS